MKNQSKEIRKPYKFVTVVVFCAIGGIIGAGTKTLTGVLVGCFMGSFIGEIVYDTATGN